MHAESRRPSHYQESRPVMLAVARQSPVHLAPLEEQIWLKMSSRLGDIFTGEELLNYGWSRKGMRWDDADSKTRTNNRQHVVGVLHELRRVLHSHGQYTIETTYPKADGKRGWRLREMTNADRTKLRDEGYFGGSFYELALAGQAEQPALPAGEPDRAIELAPDQRHEAIPERLSTERRECVDHECFPLEPDAGRSFEPGGVVAVGHLAAELGKGG